MKVLIFFFFFLLLHDCCSAGGGRGAGGGGKHGDGDELLLSFQVQVDSSSTLKNSLEDFFVSTTLDYSLLLDHDVAFNDSVLATLCQGLTSQSQQTVLRIGGTLGDSIYYQIGSNPPLQNNSAWTRVLNQTVWDGVLHFARNCGFVLVVGINAGLGPRAGVRNGEWNESNARGFMEYNALQGVEIVGYEFGNEPNLFPTAFGENATLSPSQYASDLQVFRKLVKSFGNEILVIGPDVDFVPLLGEETGPFMEEMLPLSNGAIDVVTFHFYPTLSDKYNSTIPPIIDPFYSTPRKMVDPLILDQVGLVASYVNSLRLKYTNASAVWLGETGSAAGGGQSGVSDRFCDGFEFLDKLGLVASEGSSAVFRQTLIGNAYGLIDFDMTIRPDYWVALIAKRSVGLGVLPTSVQGSKSLFTPLRAYSFCSRDQINDPGSVTMLLLNLNQSDGLNVSVTGLASTSSAQMYLFTSDQLNSTSIFLNGVALQLSSNNTIPPLNPELLSSPQVLLPPSSFALVTFPLAAASVCSSRPS